MDADGSGECGFEEFEAWFYKTQAVPRRSGSKTQLRRTKKELRRTFRNSIKKAGILAMGGYRAMLSEELKGQVRAMAKRPNARSPDDMKLLRTLGRMNFLAVLPENALIKALARLQCTVVPANTVVMEEGEEGADKMFMIIAGSVAVYRTHLLHGDLMEHAGDLGPLEHFGDGKHTSNLSFAVIRGSYLRDCLCLQRRSCSAAWSVRLRLRAAKRP
jgi:hypothetical protein